MFIELDQASIRRREKRDNIVSLAWAILMLLLVAPIIMGAAQIAMWWPL